MKKVYEAPKMLIETVCVEMMLADSGNNEGLGFFGENNTKVNDENDEALLGKDYDISDWGGLW